MRQESSGILLSAVFVDYDNIYLSLKRKSEEAAKRFAKDAALWLKAIENGALMSPTNTPAKGGPRRIVMNRCYGNPVPRRNATDNSTDMNSFPFVRHHFLRAGFEIVDCPPLTQQLKNSSDIRMVMDVRDYLTHDTYFDEFVILSGDADFTPVLHRLRAHARRTVIFANDYTAAPYTAISDSEVRESNLISLLLEGRIGDQVIPGIAAEGDDTARRSIIAEVVATVQASPQPVPLEVLADRAVRAVGHERTIGTGWAGAGGFRELLLQALPDGLKLTENPPYLVLDTRRHITQAPAAAREIRAERTIASPAPNDTAFTHEVSRPQTQYTPPARGAASTQQASAPFLTSQTIETPQAYATRGTPADFQAPARTPARAAEPTRSAVSASVQQAITRIQEACQAPPLSPPEYRLLFEVMAQEIAENNLSGVQTIVNIGQRARERGLEIRKDDVRFVLEVVSETDPWFEQGASANLFAGRFRNFVVARCRSQGLNLSADELDLIDAWFAGNAPVPSTAIQPQRVAPQQNDQQHSFDAQIASARATMQQIGQDIRSERFRPFEDTPQQYAPEQRAIARAPQQPAQTEADHSGHADFAGDEFPRIVRTRVRG
ncbi:MAG: NYN domain-containing protein [Hyphomicrobiaceae bacterium]